jgi:hypothetical protein
VASADITLAEDAYKSVLTAFVFGYVLVVATQFVPSDLSMVPVLDAELGNVGVLVTKFVPSPINTLPEVAVFDAPVPPSVGVNIFGLYAIYTMLHSDPLYTIVMDP